MDPEWLERKYRGEGRTQAEVAEEAGVSQATVSNRLRELGIETRRRGPRSTWECTCCGTTYEEDDGPCPSCVPEWAEIRG